MARLGRRQCFQPIIKRPVFAAQNPVPIADRPLVLTAAAVAAAVRRTSYVIRVVNISIPAEIDYTPPPFTIPYTVVRDVQDANPRVRRHVNQVAEILNGLLASGELRGGTVGNPVLGYVAETTLSWGGDAPTTVREALDRLAASGGGSVDVSGVASLPTSASLDDTIAKINELLVALGS